VAAANEALSWVADAVKAIQAGAAPLRQHRDQARRRARRNGHAPAPSEVRELESALARLAREGVVLRDPERGLVDFPAVASDGRRYWLCWLLGEPDVAWWHWPDDGFAGRKPLSDPP
jgi:hypothetical protein